MSTNSFVKSDLQDILTSDVNSTESNWLTVSSMKSFTGGSKRRSHGSSRNKLTSITSDVFMSQINTNDVNQLVSMLTSENNMRGGSNINVYKTTLDDMVGGNYSDTSVFLDQNDDMSATSTMIGGADEMSATSTMRGGADEMSATSTMVDMPTMRGGNDNMETTTTINDMVGGSHLNGSETETAVLESQLRQLLKGRKSSRKNSGKTKKSSKKSSKRSRKSSKKMSGGARRSHKSSKKSSKRSRKSSRRSSKMKGGDADELSATSEDEMVGGGKKSSKKNSKKSSKKSSKKNSHKGAPRSPAFAAALKIRAHIAKTLGVPNGKEAVKVTFAAIKKVRESNSTDDVDKLADLAKNEFDSNVAKYKKMI